MDLLVFILIIVIIILWYKNANAGKKIINAKRDLSVCKEEATQDLEECKGIYERKLELLVLEFDNYKSRTEYLRRYEHFVDLEAEADRIKLDAKKQIEFAQENARNILGNARKEAKEVRGKAEKKLNDAHLIATKIEHDAHNKAIQVAGDAWEAKENAQHYQETERAMKNIIKGYGDEYLIPNETLLDKLAEAYNHTEAGNDLIQIRKLIKSMIKNQEIADCNYVEEERREMAMEFVTDAFNGKVASIMARVKHDNYGVLKQKLQDAFRIVNHNGKSFKKTRILDRYFKVILQQLKLSVTVHELKKRDQEEQRTIREAIREEEKARREYEKALKQSEKEERMIAKALKEAEAKLKGAALEEKARYETELNKLKGELELAQEKGQRALSMAQQTKRGHVYIISNVGSFGENIFKIGLTRRLDPMDRVKELGDASVPFSFDVHAIIFSENAPALEKELHATFKTQQVNKVNPRKEFFRLPLTEIKDKVSGMDLETHWTMKAEAMEYRESLQLSQQN